MAAMSALSNVPFYKQSPLLPYTSAHFYCPTISFLDESEEEVAMQPLTKEEEEVEVMQSWVEVRAFQPAERRKPRGYWQRQVHPLVPILPSFSIDTESSLTILAFYLNNFLSLSSGVRVITTGKSVARGGTETRREGTTAGDRWVGKMREAVAGSEAEGLYGFLRESHHTPTLSHLNLL